jgi:hypothetical protein
VKREAGRRLGPQKPETEPLGLDSGRAIRYGGITP